MRNLRKIQPHLQSQLDDIVKTLISSYPEKIKINKLKWYVTDTYKGCALRDGQFTVPMWAYEKGIDYFTYYTAHELAHQVTRQKHGENHHHGAKFYSIFRELCPAHLQHHELRYKKRAKIYIVRNNE